MRTTWQHAVPLPELYAVIKFHFIRIFPFKVPNKRKTLQQTNWLLSSEKYSNKLQPKPRHFNTQHSPGSLFLYIHKAPLTILIKIAKVATASLFGVCTSGVHSSPCQHTPRSSQIIAGSFSAPAAAPDARSCPAPLPGPCTRIFSLLEGCGRTKSSG